MADTKVVTLSQINIHSGLPDGWSNPIRPEKFAGFHEGQLGKAVNMTQFGVNHVVLEPGMWSALRHWHEKEDEFVYVLTGTVTLVDDNGSHPMEPGSFVGFPAGDANGHHLVNDSDKPASYLAVGSRFTREIVHYPDDDVPGSPGK